MSYRRASGRPPPGLWRTELGRLLWARQVQTLILPLTLLSSRPESLICRPSNQTRQYSPQHQLSRLLTQLQPKNLHGTPNACRNYIKFRDNFIMTAFNQNGWSCKKSTMDPSLFVLEREGKKTWLVAYVDDIDAASECETHLDLVFNTFNKDLADLYTKGVPKEVFEFLAPYLCGHTNATSLLKMIKDQGGQSQ